MIVPVSAFVALFACTAKTGPDAAFVAGVCDAGALVGALDAGTPGRDAVIAACPGEAVASALAGGPADPPCVAAATDRAALAACDPALGAAGEVLLASGDPRAAARARAFLVANGVDEVTATRAAIAIRGAPLAAAPADLVLPAATGPAPTAAAHVLSPQGLSGAVTLGLVDGRLPDARSPSGLHPFPKWRIEGMTAADAATVVVDARVTAPTFGRLAASAVKPGGTLTLVGLSGDALGTVSVALPAAGAAPGPQSVALPERSTVAELVARIAAIGPGAVLDLSIAPCRPGPAGMSCVPGGPTTNTFWIDEAPVSQAAWAACVAAPFCAPIGGKDPTKPVLGAQKAQASRYCAWAGKRLPTDAEVAASPAPAPGLRCATSDPWTTAFPPPHLVTPYPAPPDPTPPTAEQLAIAHGIVADSLEDKGVCGEDVRQYWSEKHKKGGHSTLACRDPISYITPNEPRAYVFRRYLTNVGGGYVGVASDTNYSFIAAARSEWAWLMDYDPNVVRVHQVIRAVMLKSPTRQEFVARFAPDASEATQTLLDEAYGDDPQAQMIRALYSGRRGQLYNHYKRNLTAPKGDPAFGWLAHDDQYAYVRKLYEQGRITILGGDLLADKSMTGIGAAARQLGVPIRIYYTSNAPSAWGSQATPQHKANVLALPMDERSLYVATTNKGGFAQTGYWHNMVIGGLYAQERLRSPATTHVRALWADRIPTDDGDTTMTGVSGR